MEKIHSFTIVGDRINSIGDFYEQINQLFMQGEDWKIGQSLDALNDLFHGGFGTHKSMATFNLIWTNVTKSKRVLGLETTIEFYQDKLSKPEIYNREFAKSKLLALEQGTGQTYFEIILEIIESHPSINFIPA
jgi:RNAse (barnase) inhibitor barstar